MKQGKNKRKGEKKVVIDIFTYKKMLLKKWKKKQNKTKQKEGIYHVLRIRLKPNVKNKAVLLASKRILVKYITT